MNNDRLVICPECDELVVEDEWHIHAKWCRPRRLHELSTDEFLQELSRRDRINPNWAEDFERREHTIADAIGRWNANDFHHGELRVGFYHSPTTMCVGEHASKPVTSSLQTIVVRLPEFPLESKVAHALIREQIEQQWKEYSEEPL